MKALLFLHNWLAIPAVTPTQGQPQALTSQNEDQSHPAFVVIESYSSRTFR
jgi:hypothetical protein